MRRRSSALPGKQKLEAIPDNAAYHMTGTGLSRWTNAMQNYGRRQHEYRYSRFSSVTLGDLVNSKV
jgi:hypothetical protein